MPTLSIYPFHHINRLAWREEAAVFGGRLTTGRPIQSERLGSSHLHGSANDKYIPRELLVLSSQFRANRPAKGGESLPLQPVS